LQTRNPLFSSLTCLISLSGEKETKRVQREEIENEEERECTVVKYDYLKVYTGLYGQPQSLRATLRR